MAEHTRHSTANKGDPSRTDEHADRVEPALVQLARLLGRQAARGLLHANSDQTPPDPEEPTYD